MLVYSITLAGGHREGSILGALDSAAGIVDKFLLLDTWSADEAIRVAREKYGDRVLVERTPFELTDSPAITKSRNFGLEKAAELGADWALILDTDERIEERGEKLREALETTPADVVMLLHVTCAYEKDRFIRLPAKGQFEAPYAHEYYNNFENRIRAKHARFNEIPKTPEQMRLRMVAIERDMHRAIEAQPEVGRWYYYLGDCQHYRGDYEIAIKTFEQAIDLAGYPLEAAWSAYRGAECALRMKNFPEAIRLAVRGIARLPGVAELPWAAGVASLQLGNVRDALSWAECAIAWGNIMGKHKSNRTGFTFPPALWEAPFRLLSAALAAGGDQKGAQDASRMAERAHQIRLTKENQGKEDLNAAA